MIGAFIGKAIGFLGGGLGGKIALGLAVAVAVMAGIAAWQFYIIGNKNEQIGGLKQSLNTAVEVGNANAREVERQAKDFQRDLAAIAAADAEARKKLAVVNKVKETVRVQPSDAQPASCPAVPGPIVRSLDGLRQLRAAANH